MTIRLLLADDHAVVRSGFKLLLTASPEFEIVAEADSGEDAYRLFIEHGPDVVIMDLAMPGMGGIEAIKKIIARDKNARVLALSAHEDLSHPNRALQAGALGYLSKRGAPEALLDAVRTIAKGKRIIDPQIAQRMAIQKIHGEANPVEQLSEREFVIFMQLARGQSVNQIAEVLSLSPSTVGTHFYNIKQKLAVNNQSEMTLIAVRHGLIDP